MSTKIIKIFHIEFKMFSHYYKLNCTYFKLIIIMCYEIRKLKSKANIYAILMILKILNGNYILHIFI